MLYYILSIFRKDDDEMATRGDIAATPWIDLAAVGASLLCLVHCIGLPLLLVAAPGIGVLANLPESVHEILLAVALPLAMLGLGRGWRGHRNSAILVLGGGGLCLMALAIMFEDQRTLEVALTMAGVFIVATAHVLNWRALHRLHRHR
jgi:MerC mercury resistance protein